MKIDAKLGLDVFKLDKEPHIVIDTEVCKAVCRDEACIYVCPADLYERDDQGRDAPARPPAGEERRRPEDLEGDRACQQGLRHALARRVRDGAAPARQLAETAREEDEPQTEARSHHHHARLPVHVGNLRFALCRGALLRGFEGRSKLLRGVRLDVVDATNWCARRNSGPEPARSPRRNARV